MSVAQRVCWEQWLESWEKVALLRKQMNARLFVVLNGDAVEGDHHNTAQIVTKRKDEQERMCVSIFETAFKIVGFDPRKGDVFMLVLGTPVHVEHSEERIARDLLDPKTHKPYAKPLREPTAAAEFKDGCYVRQIVRYNNFGNRIQIAHHPPVGPGRRAWTTNNALTSWTKSEYFKYAERRKPLPRYKVFAHKHRFVKAKHEGEYGTIETIILPSFQAKTEFGHRVANGDPADIGMCHFVFEPDGNTWWDANIVQYDEEDEYEVL